MARQLQFGKPETVSAAVDGRYNVREESVRRLRDMGAMALSDVEIVANVLPIKGGRAVEIARDLLVHFSGVGGLLRANLSELEQVPGMSTRAAAALKSALELARRLLLVAPSDRVQIRSPEDIAALLMVEMGALEQEQLRVLLLDTRHQVIRQVTVYQGSVNAAYVRVGEVFREAVRDNAVAIVLVHNHPSGDPAPSPEDVSLSKEVVQAGKMLSIDVLDHLVVGRSRYVSMRERGLAF